jgi:hypothetical protein
MSHKDAPPETPEQVRCREFYASRGVEVGWGRDKDGRYFAPFASNAWAAWQEAQRVPSQQSETVSAPLEGK